MIVNSLGDWVVYGLGLIVVVYGATRLLPDIIVAGLLGIYRSYRKLRIGIEQAKRDMPTRKEKAAELGMGEEALQEVLGWKGREGGRERLPECVPPA